MALIPAPQLFIRNPLAFPAGVAPGFNPNHVAAKNTLFSAVASQGGNFVNLLTGKPADTIVGSPTFIMDGIVGPSVYFSGSTDACGFTTSIPVYGTSAGFYTIAAIFRLISHAGQNGFIISTNTSDDFQVTTGAVLRWISTNTELTSGITLTNGHSYFVASSLNAANSSTGYFVVLDLTTGKLIGESQTSGNNGFTVSTTYWVGNASTGSKPSNSYISALHVSTQFLSEQQLLQWAQAPWDFWYPPQDYSFVRSAASPFTWLGMDSGNIDMPMSHFRREMMAHD